MISGFSMQENLVCGSKPHSSPTHTHIAQIHSYSHITSAMNSHYFCHHCMCNRAANVEQKKNNENEKLNSFRRLIAWTPHTCARSRHSSGKMIFFSLSFLSATICGWHRSDDEVYAIE